MSPGRLSHIERVVETACQLADYWRVSQTHAAQAAYLHDCAKYLDPDTLREWGASDTCLHQKLFDDYPLIWHAFAGADWVNYLGICTNPSVLNAIRWHTTGKPAMSKLSQIIYLADYIEPGRQLDSTPIRQRAFTDLDNACYELANHTIHYLESIGKKIHPMALQCHDYYMLRCVP